MVLNYWETLVSPIAVCLGLVLTSGIQGAEHLKKPIYITPSRASKSAIRAVEKVGGSVFCKYYNDLALRDCLKGRTDRTEATPVRQTDIGTDYAFWVCALGSLYSQFGTRRGRIEVISHRRHWTKCLLLLLTNDGVNCRSNYLFSRSRSTIDRSRANLIGPSHLIIAFWSLGSTYTYYSVAVSILSGEILRLRDLNLSEPPPFASSTDAPRLIESLGDALRDLEGLRET